MNRETKTLARNFSYNVLSQIVSLILPIITAPYISRVLGAERLGVYSYSYSIAYYFLLFGMLGVANYGSRSISAVRDDAKRMSSTFWEIYLLQLLTMIAAIAAYGVYLLFQHQSFAYVLRIDLLLVISGAFDVTWLFSGIEEFKLPVKRNILIKLITLLLIFLFVRDRDDLWAYTLIMSGCALVSQVYLWGYIKRYISLCRVKWSQLVKHIRPLFVLFIPSISYSVYKYISKILLGNITSMHAVGIYENADKINTIPLGIITALGVVMLPRMSNMFANGQTDKVLHYLKQSIKFVTLVASAIAFGLIGISPVLAPVFLGEEFSQSAPIITLLSLSFLFTSWASILRTQYLIPKQRDSVYVLSTIFGAITNILINLCLIPIWAERGAGIAIIASEAVMMISQSIMIRKEFRIWKSILQTAPFLIIGVLMCVAVRYIGSILGISLFTLIIQICAGGLIYVSLVCLYLFVRKDDYWTLIIRAIKAVMRRIIHNNPKS